MAYEDTEVPLAKSQDGIRKIVYSHKGTGISFVSQPPREGFEALVTMAGDPYHIRIMATCREKDRHGWKLSGRQKQQEERRIWRVLFHHLKAMFEAADSGVIAIEDIILPYIVTPDNRTIGEHMKPKLAELRNMESNRLLQAANL